MEAVPDVPPVLAARLFSALTALEEAALVVAEADRLLGHVSAPSSVRQELVVVERLDCGFPSGPAVPFEHQTRQKP
ncbi:hypothetical protein GCM10026982_05350 [Nocardiopsis aegyptia]